uniref:Integrase catalytic domain-containing protein n=1 Tax=Plectus sambesii TaxID=2011161 RepID=A0A914UKE9_9BILA
MESICRLGPPSVLISDRARNLNSSIINGMCQLIECDKRKSTAYHPMTDGTSERFIRTLNQMLGFLVSEQQTDWDRQLKYCAFAFRTAVCHATGFSPYRLTYGRTAHLPIENWLSVPHRQFKPDYPDFVTELRYDLARVFQQATKRLNQDKELQATSYNRKASESQLKISDYVYLEVKQFPSKLQKKWLPKYTGPFQCIEINSPNVTIETTERGLPQRQIVHESRLRKATKAIFPTDYAMPTDTLENENNEITAAKEDQSSHSPPRRYNLRKRKTT